jgi:hypothetical protein
MSHIWAVRVALRELLQRLETNSSPGSRGCFEYISRNREDIVRQLMTGGEAKIGRFRLKMDGTFSEPLCPDCGEKVGTNWNECALCESERVECEALSF